VTSWRAVNDSIEDAFVAAHARGTAIVDVGAGDGRATRQLVLAGHTVSAIDVAADALHACRAASGRCLPVVGDAERLPLATESVDTLVSLRLLRHYPDWPMLLAEWLRVLKPGGRALFDAGSGDQRDLLQRTGRWTDDLAGDPRLYPTAPTAAGLRRQVEALGGCVAACLPHDVVWDNMLVPDSGGFADAQAPPHAGEATSLLAMVGDEPAGLGSAVLVAVARAPGDTVRTGSPRRPAGRLAERVRAARRVYEALAAEEGS
jgi:SAM-dependent methyltransferase